MNQMFINLANDKSKTFKDNMLNSIKRIQIIKIMTAGLLNIYFSVILEGSLSFASMKPHLVVIGQCEHGRQWRILNIAHFRILKIRISTLGNHLIVNAI